MAIVAEIVKQSDLEGGDKKFTIFLVAIVYDDTDPNKTPLGQPVELQIERDGFTNTEKTEAAQRAAIAAAVNAQVGEKVAEYQKTADVAKSLVGQIIPLTDSKKG